MGSLLSNRVGDEFTIEQLYSEWPIAFWSDSGMWSCQTRNESELREALSECESLDDIVTIESKVTDDTPNEVISGHELHYQLYEVPLSLAILWLQYRGYLAADYVWAK